MVNLLEAMHKCCLPSGVQSESPGAYKKSLVHKIFGGCLRSQVCPLSHLYLFFYVFTYMNILLGICIILYCTGPICDEVIG